MAICCCGKIITVNYYGNYPVSVISHPDENVSVPVESIRVLGKFVRVPVINGRIPGKSVPKSP